MIRLITDQNDFDLFKQPELAIAGMLYEHGFDLAKEFVDCLKSLLTYHSVYDLLKLYIILSSNGVSIACASLLVFYDPSSLDECLTLLEKRAEKYTNGFSSVVLRIKGILNNDLSIFDWLGYSIDFSQEYAYNPLLFIDWVSSVDADLATANNYLKQGYLLLFVKEVLKLKTGVVLTFEDDMYAQWTNSAFNSSVLGAGFNQSIGANYYV